MDELVSRHDIAQLIRSTQLDPASIMLEQMVEVISLEHLVQKLGQAHALGTLEPGLDALTA